MSPQRTRRPGRWLRARALLAGALVLGISATVTVAAWTDREFTAATATAGVFGIEGSTDRVTFAEHPAGAPATLAYTPDLGPLVPGNSAFMTYTVRMTSNSTYGSSAIQMSTASPANGGLVPRLSYSVRTVAAGAACDAAVFDAAVPADRIIVANFTPLEYSVPPNTTVLAAGSTLTYCIRVTLFHETRIEDANKTATPSWQFTGTSR